MAPLFFYRRTSKRLLKAVDYHQPSNCFELLTYRNTLLKIPVEELVVRYNPLKEKVVH
jgi:hypothetical protein